MVSDCLKEREYQVAINRRKDDLLRMLEKNSIDRMHEDLLQQDKVEKKKAEERQAKKKRNIKAL